MDRRSFLRGALSIAAIAVSKPVAALLPSYPILYGDGIHDDAPAFNAFFRNEPILCEGEVLQNKPGAAFVLRTGNYLLKSAINILGSEPVHISGSTFTASSDFKDNHLIHIEKSEFVSIEDCHFNRNSVGDFLSFNIGEK